MKTRYLILAIIALCLIVGAVADTLTTKVTINKDVDIQQQTVEATSGKAGMTTEDCIISHGAAGCDNYVYREHMKLLIAEYIQITESKDLKRIDEATEALKAINEKYNMTK